MLRAAAFHQRAVTNRANVTKIAALGGLDTYIKLKGKGNVFGFRNALFTKTDVLFTVDYRWWHCEKLWGLNII